MQRQIVKKPIMVQAADLLARQEHSSAKLKEKLRRRGYEESDIDTAIEKLIKARYLNDEDACRRAFEYFYNAKRLSVRSILQKLQQRGFSRELANSFVPEDISEHELEAAVNSLQRKYRSSVPTEKMQQFLYMHGFSGGIRRQAIEQFAEELQTELEKENGFE